MITAVVNAATYVEFRLQTYDGTPIEDAVIGDFTTEPVAKLLPSGATTATPTITEIGDGWYAAVFSSGLAVGHWLYYHVYDADNDWSERVQVITAAQADPAQALSGVTATIEERVNIDGDRIELVRGDAYLNADGLAKAWTVAGVSVASATISFNTFAGVTAFSKAMVVSGSTIYVDLTTANTSGLTKGTPVYRYEVIATLSGGGTSTLFRGDVWVTD